MNDAITVDYRPLAVADTRPIAAPQLLDALCPAERVALLTEIANVVKDVIEKQGWYKQIGPKKHILIQGWTFIGGLGGCSVKTTHTEKIDGGFKASAVVVRVDTGVEVGAADQVCMSSESKWRGKDDYALVGMASTRACSRALSTVFRHVVELAGYSATPGEEMTHDDPPPSKPEPPVEDPRAAAAAKDAALCARWMAATGGDDAAYKARMAGLTLRERREATEAAERAPEPKQTPETASWQPSDKARKAMFALHGELGHKDADRYAFYSRVCGRPITSASQLGKLDFEVALKALNLELDKRNAGVA